MKKIVIADYIQLNDKSWKKIRDLGPDVIIYEDLKNNEDEIINRIKDAQIITANYIDINRQIIDASHNLEYIIVPAVGYEWVDVEACNRRGIKVINCPTHNSYAVAEHAISMIFVLFKNLCSAHNSILKGKWEPKEFTNSELRNKSLYVIGNGNIGKKIQFIGKRIGMHVRYANSKTERSEIDYNIGISDVIVLAIPLKKDTLNFFDSQRLDLLKKNSILVNVARGSLVDMNRLYEKLLNKEILGAGLDVFPNDELIEKPGSEIVRFAKLTNTVVTPHIAYKSFETAERLGNELYDNLVACISDNPINVVN